MGLIKVFTDGSCLKNGNGGIGVCFPNKEYSNASIPIEGKTTNQRTELLAIAHALGVIDDNMDIELTSDSLYSINSLTIWYPNWIKKNTIKTKKNLDIITPLYNYIQRHPGKITFKHVRGHRGNIWNEKADQLATMASAALQKK